MKPVHYKDQIFSTVSLPSEVLSKETEKLVRSRTESLVESRLKLSKDALICKLLVSGVMALSINGDGDITLITSDQLFTKPATKPESKESNRRTQQGTVSAWGF